MPETQCIDLETWWRLFHQLPDAVLCLDNTGEVIFYNPVAERLLEFDANEFSSLELEQFVFEAASMRPVDFKGFRQFALSNESREIVLESKARVMIPTLLSVSILPNPEDCSDQILLAIFRDIRALKQAEARSNDEKKLFEILINNINEAVFLAPLTSEGVHGNFVEVNDVACRRLGYSKEELLQMNARTLNPAANLGKVKAFGRHIRREGNTIFEAIHVTKDGTPFPVYMRPL